MVIQKADLKKRGLNYKVGQTFFKYHRLTVRHHRDPFDRLLIWQAIIHNYVLLSNDSLIHQYVDEGLKVE